MSSSASNVDTYQNRKFPKHLMETYDIDENDPVVGSGAFSTVFRCKNRETGQVYALKRMDTRRGHEHRPRKISHEVTMMNLAGSHENCLQCHNVYLEGPYVNIVVDMFSGGDLIDGFNVHRKARGMLSDSQLAVLLRQMLAAVMHIHSLHIVHRDVKGENFLTATTDIGDPNCHIALADFGCAEMLCPGKMLAERAGTSAFWAPEIYAGEYDHLVDVWALGVTAYVLLAGTLPFHGEEEICRAGGPNFTTPLHTSPSCEHFIRACLAHDPCKRLKADEAAHHPWLKPLPRMTPAELRVKNSLTYGASVCASSLKFITGLCSCCVGAIASGFMVLLKNDSVKASQEANTAITGLVEATGDDSMKFTTAGSAR